MVCVINTSFFFFITQIVVLTMRIFVFVCFRINTGLPNRHSRWQKSCPKLIKYECLSFFPRENRSCRYGVWTPFNIISCVRIFCLIGKKTSKLLFVSCVHFTFFSTKIMYNSFLASTIYRSLILYLCVCVFRLPKWIKKYLHTRYYKTVIYMIKILYIQLSITIY